MNDSWLDRLEVGDVRAAEPLEGGGWRVNLGVKEGILEAFRRGSLVQSPDGMDYDTLLPRRISEADRIRLVPRGSAIRSGAYVAPGVIIMPPSYINVGAYVDQGTLVDSHVLVGSCAQIGRNVHLSAGVQIGGVLEPIGELPVIVEDGAFVGAGVVIVEGIRVGREAVIGPGVTLSRGVRIYDLVEERVRPAGEPVPDRAVIVPGARPASGEWARHRGISLQCPVLVKYRDPGSDASLQLEEALR